jgi:SAM-dependent methyltransferase
MPIATEPAQSPLSADLQAILRCLSCGSKLDSDDAGGYVCPACKRAYPNVNGIARFVDAQHYAASFGFQWHRYQKTQLDHDEVRESEHNFRMKTALRPEELAGKLVLDVGCGMGRFAEVATRWGARVVGIDLSAAAEVAAKNLADRDFIAYQADVFALPFAPESFDVIYSVGVLHHTPDCEAAVKTLGKYLKPGGILAVWLYSGYNKWYRLVVPLQRFLAPLHAQDETGNAAQHPESCRAGFLQHATGIEESASPGAPCGRLRASRFSGESPEKSGKPDARYL